MGEEELCLKQRGVERFTSLAEPFLTTIELSEFSLVYQIPVWPPQGSTLCVPVGEWERVTPVLVERSLLNLGFLLDCIDTERAGFREDTSILKYP